MHGFVLFSNFFLKVTSFTYTLTSIRWGPLHFHNIYKIVIVFIFYENENTENVFSFLYSKPTFRILKMKTWVQILIPNQFFVVGPIENWKWKQKTILFIANYIGSKRSFLKPKTLFYNHGSL